jgi:putative iron-regulated protein
MTGALVFTAFELGGERLTVAYDTQDQEQEHSCFSDTSCSDLVEGHAGLVALLRGTLDGERVGPGLIAAIAAANAECAAVLERRLDAATAAVAAVPHPFDQAIVGKDDAPGRVALRAAIEALEAQAEALAFAGNVLGYELPVRPGN